MPNVFWGAPQGHRTRRSAGPLHPYPPAFRASGPTSRSSSATTRQPACEAIIAIYSTALGPALGGTRFYPYASEEEALDDVLNLSRGHGLQGRARRAGPRRRQGRHHRRPRHRQDRGAAARLRPVRAVAERPLLHRLRRRHLQRGHGRHRPRVPLRHRPHRRARRRRRLLGAHRVRRVPGHARRGRARVGRAHAARAHASASRASARSAATWSSTCVEDGARGRRSPTSTRPPSTGVRSPSTPRSRSWPTADALVALRPRRLRPLRARRRPQRRDGRPRCRRQDRLRRRQQPARPPGVEKQLADRGHPLRARLRRQRRRPDPGRRRDRGVRLRPRPGSAPTGIFDTTREIFALAADEGVPPAVAADRLAERRMSEIGRLRSILL